MHCVLTLFILSCVGTFFFAHGNINAEIAEEIQRHISPLLVKYSELETINSENQKKIAELQNDILILKQENDLKTSDLLEVTQQLQRLTQAKLAPIHFSGDFCQYVDEQCPRKSREGISFVFQVSNMCNTCICMNSIVVSSKFTSAMSLQDTSALSVFSNINLN